MKHVVGAGVSHALSRCRSLLCVAGLAISTPALANHISSADVVADCNDFTINVKGDMVFSGAGAVEYAIALVPASGASIAISGSIALVNDGNFHRFDETEVHSWSEFGVSLAANYTLSGTATLVSGTTSHHTASISFSPTTSLICPCSGAIGDRVWLDSNQNGLQDPGENGLPNVQVTLSSNGLSTTALTDANGTYLFTNLCPGSYQVSVTTPTGYTGSPSSQGSNGAVDSNPSPSPVTLTSASPSDLTVDFGFYVPCLGSIGNLVWSDANSNGIQDSGEQGIAGAQVLLFQGATQVASTSTDANGLYQFSSLCPGTYQVQVVTPNGYTATGSELGTDRSVDSNPSPSTVTLTVPAPSDQTIDFGFVPVPPACIGSIGNLVWRDLDADGLQDAGEPGIAGVTVYLHAGTAAGPLLETRITDANGLYEFTGLCAGTYAVVVDTPAGLEPSPCNAGDPNDPMVDNNCSPATVTLPTNSSTDDTIDFGYATPPTCNLSINKTCEIVQPPAPAWTTCKGKIQQFTLIWPQNQGTITISGIANDAPQGIVNPGQRVTFTGPFSVNDLTLSISGAASGSSTFHVSCSDRDMDGITSTNLEQQQLPGRAQDCGKSQGNGKALSGSWINSWELDGLVDAENKVLACSQTSTPSSSCAFQLQPGPSCGTGGTYKPATLTFRYTGGGCATQSHDQAAGKTSCTGQIDPTQPVNITFPGGSASSVPPGGTFTMPRTQTQSQITLSNSGGTETLSIHTSCSQPLAVGDVYFSLTLVAEDGVGLGQQIEYGYAVTNTGAQPITGISVSDDKLGAVSGSPIASLAAGQTATLTATALIAQTVTNVAIASAAACPNGVSASATVTVLPPPACTVTATFASLSDDKVVYAVTNTSSKVVTLDTLTTTFPSGRVQVKEVRLDGAIYKADSSSLVVAPGVTIGATDWTNPDIGKRQLNPGEKRNLEILFKVKTKATAADFSGTATFAEGCQIAF